MAETPRWKESDTHPPSGPRSSTGGSQTSDYSAEVDQMRQELGRLSDKVAKSVRGAAGPLGQQFENTVAKNPTAAVLIAAGVGLIVGLMNRR